MSDASDILLYNIVHNRGSLGTVLLFSGDTFSAISKATYLGAKVDELLERLRGRGILEHAHVRSRAQCPHCGGHEFEVALACAVHHHPLKESALAPPAVALAGPPSPTSPTPPTPHICELCKRPPPNVSYQLRCVQCHTDIPIHQTGAKSESAYRLVPSKATIALANLEAVADAFAERGFQVSIPGILIGKSGLEHQFDLIAQKEQTRYAIDIESPRDALATPSEGDGPLSRVVVLGYYAKVTDVEPGPHHLLIAIPRLGEAGLKLAQAYGLSVVECPDAASIFQLIRGTIQKARIEDRWSTGIPGLDPLMGGGLTEGRVYLVLGDVGTGKTTFAIQFLLYAAHRGQHGLLITTNTKPAEVLEMADSLGLDLREQVRLGRIVMLDITHQLDELKSKGFEDVWKYKSFVARIIGDISNYVTKINADRIAIDPLTPLTPVRKYDEVREFIKDLGGLGRLVLITKELGIDGDTSLEEYFVSGVIVLRHRMVDGNQTRTLLVQKHRGAEHDTTLHTYVIEKGVGLSIH